MHNETSTKERPASVFDAAMLDDGDGATKGALALIERENQLTQRAERGVTDQLAALENAAALFTRRCQLLESCHQMAIKRTRPEDWVLFRGHDGSETAMLTGPGADLIAEVYGIAVKNLRPVDDRGCFCPEKISQGDGVYSYRATFDAFSRINGRFIENMEAERRSDEDFTGRMVDKSGAITRRSADKTAALDADLRASVARLALTKAVRVLCGMSRVPIGDLKAAWEGTTKTVAQCRRGSGYGSSEARAASGAASGEAQASGAKLWRSILARVGGDVEAGKALLRELTSFTGRDGNQFPGYEDFRRITSEKMINVAAKKLSEHPTYGDAQMGAPAEEDGE